MKHTRECIALQMQPFCNITQPPLQTNDEILFNGSSYYHKKPSTSKSEQKLCIIYSSVVKELNNLGFNEITKGGVRDQVQWHENVGAMGVSGHCSRG